VEVAADVLLGRGAADTVARFGDFERQAEWLAEAAKPLRG
jgi:hypothetical protein